MYLIEVYSWLVVWEVEDYVKSSEYRLRRKEWVYLGFILRKFGSDGFFL